MNRKKLISGIIVVLMIASYLICISGNVEMINGSISKVCDSNHVPFYGESPSGSAGNETENEDKTPEDGLSTDGRCADSIDAYGNTIVDDIYEPDDNYTDAKTIGDGEVQTHSINDGGADVDWVIFTLTNYTSVLIQATGFPYDDILISLYDSVGGVPNNQVSYDHDYNSSIEIIIPAGIYFIIVEDFGQYHEIPVYDLSLIFTSGDDGYESDDVFTEAKNIADREPQWRTINENGTDVDWATFTLNETRSLAIETYGDYGYVNTELYLYNSSSVPGTPIAYNDDHHIQFSYIWMTDLPAGKYYILVAEKGGDETVPGYYLDLRLSAVDDIFEPDDNYTDAKTISSGETQIHSICYNGTDVDWATFTVTDDSWVGIHTSGHERWDDTILYLYDSVDGVPNNLVAYNDNEYYYNEYSVIQGTELPAGTYFIKVTEGGQDSDILEYILFLGLNRSDDVYESDNVYTDAKTISSGETQSRSINEGGTDIDWVTFTLNETSSAAIRSFDSMGETILLLFDSSGVPNRPIADNYDFSGSSVPTIVMADLTPGTYYIKVTSGEIEMNVHYSLSLDLVDLGADFRIDSDYEMYVMAEREGWAGEGSSDHPFIIDGYSLDSSNGGSCIYIGNTTLCFIIKNCVLTAGPENNSFDVGAGVQFYRVIDGGIADCTISGGDYGLFIESSQNNMISHNEIRYTIHWGIRLNSSQGDSITSNLINGAGIHLSACAYCTIIENVIEENEYYGIMLNESRLNSIYSNVMKGNNGASDIYDSRHVQAYDDHESNDWNGITGNYWSDWTSPDADGDGVVDEPYSIDGLIGAKDYYPSTDFEQEASQDLDNNTMLIVIGGAVAAAVIVGGAILFFRGRR